MKRIIALILALAFVFPTAFAEETNETAVYYNRTYQGGNPFLGVTVSNKTNFITCETESDANKYISLLMNDNPDSDCYLQYAFKQETADKMIFEISLSVGDICPVFYLRLSDATDKRIYLMNVDESGAVSVLGSHIADLKKGRWTDFAFAVDFSKHTVQPYVNGKKEGRALDVNAEFEKIARILTYMDKKSAANSSLFIDNFKIYSGDEITDIGVDEEDKKAVYPVNKTEGEAGSLIYYNRAYGEEGMTDFAGVTVSAKKHEIAVSKEGDNSFIKASLTGSGDCFLKWTVPESAGRFLCVEADFLVTKLGAKIRPFQGIVNVKADGTLVYIPWSMNIGKIEENKWFNLALCFDMQSGACDIYVDRKLVYEGASYSGTFEYFSSYFADKSADDQHIYIDNYKIYEGKQIRDIKAGELPEKISVVKTDNSEALEILKSMGENVVALNVSAATIFYGCEKKVLDVGAYIKDGRTLVPVRAVSEAFGLDVVWDEAERSVSVGQNAKIVIDSAEMTLPDGSSYTLDVPAEITDGRTMLPLRALCEKILGKTVSWNERGLILIGDSEYTEENFDIAEVNSFMLYQRPDAQTVAELFSNTAHPRVVATKEDFDRVRNAYAAGNVYMKKWGDDVISSANKILNAAMPEYITGSLLSVSSAVSSRLETLGMAYQLTGDKVYAKQAYKIIDKVGSFPDWNPAHYLDVGEMSMGVAVGYDWMYDAYTVEQRSRIEEIIYKQSLSLYEASYYRQNAYTSFITVENNWNSWCNGPAIMCASAVFDLYPELCADLISKILRSQETMLKDYYPDGAWMEGSGYWNAALYPIACYIDTLKNTFGTDFNMSKTPGLEKTAYFSLNVQGPEGTNNFHDSNVAYQNCPVIFWCADTYGDDNITRVRLSQMDKYNQTGDAYAMLWYNPDISAGEINLPKDSYIKGGEFVAMRNSWDNDNGAFVSYHAGVSDINHGHIDTGTFIIDMLGERFAIDPGLENYSVPLYFSTDRYKYYKTRPEGHNLYVINPAEGKIGQERNTFAQVGGLVSAERGAYSWTDLSACYASDVNSAIRGYKLEDDRQSVVIRDEIDLKAESEIYWFTHTKADVEVNSEAGYAVFNLNGKKVKVMFDVSGDGVLSEEYGVMEAVPLETSPKMTGEDDRSDIRKFYIKLKASGKVNITVKFMPEELSDLGFDTKTPISSWTNAEGTLKPMPQINMLYVDGAEVEGFSPDKAESYKVRLPYDANVIGEVLASYDEMLYNVVIDKAEGFGDATTVKVYYKDGSSLVSTYSVVFEKAVKLDDVADMTRLQVKDAFASSTPEEAHTPIKAADNSTEAESRWAASGSGEWLCMDLGESCDVDGVGIAVMNGASRKYNFEIEYSSDGENWLKALALTATSGEGSNIEIFRFDTTVNARYVRYVGYENTQNAWNSITEFAILQNK